MYDFHHPDHVRVIKRLIKEILEQGYLIYVADEEELVLTRSRNATAILDAIGNTEATVINVVDPLIEDRIGHFLLVHDNSMYAEEVIADYGWVDNNSYNVMTRIDNAVVNEESSPI